jgi:hypothetical protein
MPKPKLKNTNVTNRTHTKTFALECAKRFRHHSFERVSDAFCEEVERNARCFIASRVGSVGHNPSKGITLY